MKRTRLFPLLAACVAIGFAWRADALEPPRVIPESGRVAKPVEQVFGTLKGYFSDVGLSKFNLVSADAATETIVARQTGIDNARWKQWAACKTDALHMVYQFSDGTATVTVKLTHGAQDTTFVTVSADLQGTYALANNVLNVACVSTGTLERQILTVAGVPQPTSSQ
jgi:hypothetical protein